MTQQDAMPGKALGELLANKWLPADVGDVTVSGLCLDHRDIARGDLFIAVAGTRNDGRRFIADAASAGAAAVLKAAENEEEKILWLGTVPVIPYAGLVRDVSAIAGRFYGDPSKSLNLVGVTGTNGKSTCSHLLAQLQSLLDKSSAVIGTLGYGMIGDTASVSDNLTTTGLTTADAIANQRILAQLKDSGADTVAMEVSSHSLHQHRVADLNFSAALFTNLSRDHLDYHGDMREYGLAKKKLFVQPGLKHRVINLDDAFGRDLVAEFSKRRDKVKTWTYSLTDGRADFSLSGIRHLPAGSCAEIETPWGSAPIHSALLGDFNLSNLLGVIAVCCAQGADLKRVAELAAKLRPVDGRMEQVPGGADLNVIVDYAHTPDSLEQALKALRAHTKGKLWCLFGCGGDRDKGKRPEMAAVAENRADAVVVTSDNPRTEIQARIADDIRAGFARPETITFIDDRAAAIEQAIENAQTGDCVLIAGKGHETYQQVGDSRLPFSDVRQARLALQKRNAQQESRGQASE